MWQLNLPTNNYKSYNSKRYQQKTKNLPTIKLSQSNIKEKLQIYQQKTTNLPTKKLQIYQQKKTTNLPTEKLQISQQKTTNLTTIKLSKIKPSTT